MALPLSYNIRNLRVRWTVTLLAVLGIALVVAVFVVLLAMGAGFSLALRSTGSDGERHRRPTRCARPSSRRAFRATTPIASSSTAA